MCTKCGEGLSRRSRKESKAGWEADKIFHCLPRPYGISTTRRGLQTEVAVPATYAVDTFNCVPSL